MLIRRESCEFGICDSLRDNSILQLDQWVGGFHYTEIHPVGLGTKIQIQAIVIVL